ncbi:hypothetical protein MIH18_08670 [Marinobacter sp. M3C]|jgi:hypothetical protein|uniref:hypothetical protein n=1 Tax=Marinobacter sp. M3C TaxID=2917715 RepID=UPI00200FCE0D|nr:hypothetical protein [Marinobacter sp. M3C]MCL1485571.1 hypothetical protein [Marinobacter sp.]UQG61978.1 hypothetical protein MIH18_08670 [Marinobacter sp. M3C]
MSGKILARVPALSLALLLAACGGGGGGDSTPLVDTENGGGNGGNVDQEVALKLGTGDGASSSFQEGQIKASATSLSAGGSTRLEFNVVNAADGFKIYNTEETSVSISSRCENAVFDTPISTISGSFSTTYEAGCAGPDVITARLSDGSSEAIVNITVAAPEIGELEFVSVTPDSIALSGSSNSSRPSVSAVTFKLTDKTGKPITTGEKIVFSLSTTLGGTTLSQNETNSDEKGLATTRVNAGSVATVVSVTATYTPENGSPIQTTSAPISISATIPDQNSFSISVADNFLPNARNYDGVEVPIFIRAADRNNNRISDAIVNFVTSGGSVQSECTLQDGVCTVTWISQNPRTDDGVVLILARTVGEESFRDLNSDGKYIKADDSFDLTDDDKGETFLDRNRDGKRDIDEEYFDYNDNGRYDPKNNIYNGTACADTATNCTTSLLEISQTAKLFMTSDLIDIVHNTDPAIAGEAICVEVAGVFQNSQNIEIKGPPPGGTNIAFSLTSGTIIGPSSFETTNSYRETPVTQCITVEDGSVTPNSTLTVEVTPPEPYGGNPYISSIDIND